MFNNSLRNQTDKEVLVELEKIRSHFLVSIINGLFFLSLVTLPFSFYVLSYLDFIFIHIVHITVLLTSILFILARNKISIEIKSKVIAILFALITISSWYYQGLNSMAILWFFVSCLIIMSLVGLKMLVIYIICFICFSYLMTLFQLSPNTIALFQFHDYQAKPALALSKIVTATSITVLFTFAFYHLQNNLLGLVQKISDQKKHINHLANHDTLTGLPTIRLADDRLSMAIKLAKRNKHHVGVLFLDLDGFKVVNDTYGHQAGDDVLKTVSRRLVKQCRDPDTICRIGGDEFLIVLGDVENTDNIDTICQRLVSSISAPIDYKNQQLVVGISIGYAVFPEHGDEPNLLKSIADKAMYAVKKSGKNSFLKAKAPENDVTEQAIT